MPSPVTASVPWALIFAPVHVTPAQLPSAVGATGPWSVHMMLPGWPPVPCTTIESSTCPPVGTDGEEIAVVSDGTATSTVSLATPATLAAGAPGYGVSSDST